MKRAVEGTLELSTQPLQPAWKQEVNQRIAAHKNRKGTASSADGQAQEIKPGNSRAAEAAARVAARYAKAPSYSQMQAEEARMAVRAAEIATQVALEAQKTAESALAELHAAATEPMRGPAVVESITRAPREEMQEIAETAFVLEPPEAAPIPAYTPEPAVAPEPLDPRTLAVRWEPDMPTRALEMPAPMRKQEQFELASEDWWTPAQVSATLRNEPIAVDPGQIHANLIEFPRELIATRKMRPRLLEPADAVEQEGQLSIFEVDPGAVSIEPQMEAMETAPLPAWSGPEWSGMELEAQPAREELQAQPRAQHGLVLAPLGLRLLAWTVDGSLIAGVFFSAVMWMTGHMQQVPAPKTAEVLCVLGVLLTALLYHAVCFALGGSTPGMKYAGIALSTFDDEVPTHAQLRRRLGAMAVSVLPVGLGVVWSVFDDDHLSWHDRMSQTYLRKR